MNYQPNFKVNSEITGYLETNGEVGKQKFLEPFPPGGCGIAQAKVLAFDFETTGGAVKYPSNEAKGKAKVCLDPRKATPRLISFATEGGCELLRPEEWPLLISVLADPTVTKVCHNMSFDLSLVRAAYGKRPVINTCFCTMLVNQLLVAGIYDKSLRHSSLKGVVKNNFGHELDKSLQASDWSGVPSKEQLEYALKDSQILIPLHNVLKQKLDKNGLTEVAQIEFNCIPVTVEVAQTGLPFNTEAAKDKIASLDTEINIVSGKLNEIVLKSGWQSLLNPRNRKHSILQVLNIC